MSFEFERPTCYSPNGLVFGVLREGHAYSAPCRTTADGPFDNRIIWYFVDEDAPLYEGTNAFEPRVDNIYDLKHETFEVSRLSPCPRKHYSGRDIWFRDGTFVIGDVDDFAGRSLVGKCLCQEGPPNPPCVSGPHAFNEIGLAGKFKVVSLPDFLGKLRLGGKMTTPPPFAARGGLALAGVMTYIPPPPIELEGGLALGGFPWTLFTYNKHVNGGIALRDTLTQVNIAELDGSIALGVVKGGTPTDQIEIEGAIALGILSPGGSFAGGSRTENGLALGARVQFGEEDEEGGGPSCAEAREIVLFTNYFSTYETMADQWYKLPVFEDHTWHVKLLAESTTNFHADCYFGTTCGDMEFFGELDDEGDCVDITLGEGEDGFIFIQAFSAGGTLDAVFTTGIGECDI